MFRILDIILSHFGAQSYSLQQKQERNTKPLTLCLSN